jgi:hypothetical protein
MRITNRHEWSRINAEDFNQVKTLLAVTAVIELAAGLAFGAIPSAAVVLLLGTPLDTPAAVALGRVAGAALLALAVACWLASRDAQSAAARGVVCGMVVYNVGAAIVLAAAGMQMRTAGIMLWAAVALHAAMTAWCVRNIIRRGNPVG